MTNRGQDALSALFAPCSVAIFGASSDPGKMSGRSLANLKRFGFGGAVYPINPHHAEVQGYRAYKSLKDIGQPVDLTLIMTPAAGTIDAVCDGLAAGSRSFIVYAAGYAEHNEAGAALERTLRDLLAPSDARLLGPNCTGMINCQAGVCATFSTVVDQMAMTPGGISFVGQSGAMAAYWLEKTLRAGLGFAKWISTGNEVDISLADAIQYLVNDDATECICAYIEGTSDGSGLRNALQAARAAGKPVLMLRSGRSAAGASAAASHTGAMAGEDAVWRALFRQEGVIECASLSAMVNLTRLLHQRPTMPVRRPLILSISGGAGALAADAASEAGLEIVPLPEELKGSVEAILPDLGQLSNPLDLTANLAADPGLFARTGEAVSNAACYDSFIVFLGLMHNARDVIAQALKQSLIRSGKPVFLIWMGASDGVKATLRSHDILAFDDIPDAIEAIAAWNAWCEARDRSFHASDRPTLPRPAQGYLLSEYAGQRLLGEVGALRWPEAVLVEGAEGICDVAIPPAPWVVKLQSGHMPHKTEHGGVALDIGDDEALRATVAEMRALAERMRIPADGVLVQEMVPHDHQLMVGIRSDPIFGPLLMVGRGGVEAEFEKDVALRLFPLSQRDIEEMLRELRYGSRLAGVRGKAGIDFAALAAAIEALCRRYSKDNSIVEMEINPLAVSISGDIAALDLLVTVADRGEDGGAEARVADAGVSGS